MQRRSGQVRTTVSPTKNDDIEVVSWITIISSQTVLLTATGNSQHYYRMNHMPVMKYSWKVSKIVLALQQKNMTSSFSKNSQWVDRSRIAWKLLWTLKSNWIKVMNIALALRQNNINSTFQRSYCEYRISDSIWILLMNSRFSWKRQIKIWTFGKMLFFFPINLMMHIGYPEG